MVAPYTGAWIEISWIVGSHLFALVAPYTGAWIEISKPQSQNRPITGRTLHGCVD